MARATIKDIARKLDISPSTVSRALRDHPDISVQTKKLVNALARQLDYQPDSIAQSLQKKSTKTIGVIVPEIKHDFFASAISGIEDLAYKSGFTIIVSQSNEDFQREILNVQSLASNRVAGLLVSISQTTRNGDHFKPLLNQGIPIVFFNRVCEDLVGSRVVVDDYQGAYRAVTHLIERGYQRIAHLAGPLQLMGSRLRYEGYMKALKDAGREIDPSLIIHGGMHEDDGVIGMNYFLSLDNRPDAVFAINDPVAVGAFIHLKEMKLRIPEDVALVGFSNNPIVSLLDPPLTTVDELPYELGKTAVQLLLDQIENKEKSLEMAKTVELKTKLIIRKSS